MELPKLRENVEAFLLYITPTHTHIYMKRLMKMVYTYSYVTFSGFLSHINPNLYHIARGIRI